ncbi:MAG: SGNH/GDSL hydrolase family protein, partial [bacterium]
DLVVLQGSPSAIVNDPEGFARYAGLWKEAIAQAGAATALFVPHSFDDSPEYADSIAALCERVAREIGALTIPINQAWYAVKDRHPDIVLFGPDGIHPTAQGTVLYTYAAFATIFQQSPEGIEYSFDYVCTPDERSYMQSITWEIVRSHMDWGR